MNVAMCLQGQPRNWKPALSKLQTDIISKYNADVFGHTWWDEKAVGKQYDVAPFSKVQKYEIKNDSIKELQSAFEFKKFKYNSPRKFLDNKKYNTIMPGEHDRIIDSLKSRYFSLMSVLTLVEDYEKENDIEYDWVGVARYDIQVMAFPELVMLDTNKIYTTMKYGSRQFIMDDNFWIFGKKHKFIFKNLFKDFDKNHEILMNDRYTEEQKEIIKGTELEKCKFINGEEFMAIHLLLNGGLTDTIKFSNFKTSVIH